MEPELPANPIPLNELADAFFETLAINFLLPPLLFAIVISAIGLALFLLQAWIWRRNYRQIQALTSDFENKARKAGIVAGLLKAFRIFP